MGGGDRRRGPHPGDPRPGLPGRHAGPAGPGGDRPAGGHARRRRGGRRRPRVAPAEPAPSQADAERLRAMLAEARRPVALLGGSRWSAETCAGFAAWAARHDVPVAVSFRRAQLFPADHPNFAGELGIGPNPALLARIKDSDLLLMVGGRLSEMPAQSYGLLGIPDPGLPLVHVHPDRRNSAGSTSPPWRSRRARRRSARPCRTSSRPGRAAPPRPTPPTARGRRHRSRSRGRSSTAKRSRGCGSGCRRTR